MTNASDQPAQPQQNAEIDEVSPLGLGHDPIKDPMKGFRGMVSATLLLEAISIFLGLLVILKIDGGSYWITFNWAFITALGAAHLVMLGFVSREWALPTILGIQVVGLFGFMIHWSLGAIMVLFIAIWGFALHLRSTLVERMRRGYLTTQHLDAK